PDVYTASAESLKTQKARASSLPQICLRVRSDSRPSIRPWENQKNARDERTHPSSLTIRWQGPRPTQWLVREAPHTSRPLLRGGCRVSAPLTAGRAPRGFSRHARSTAYEMRAAPAEKRAWPTALARSVRGKYPR